MKRPGPSRRLELSTPLACSAEAAWEAVQRRALLEYVTHPLLKIMPAGLDDLPLRLAPGGRYRTRLYLFGLLPLGEHRIDIKRVDAAGRVIDTEERGRLASLWRHRLALHTDAQGRTWYTDTLEIGAGRWTPVLGAVAHLFYRYRQRRWRGLARTLEAPCSI